MTPCGWRACAVAACTAAVLLADGCRERAEKAPLPQPKLENGDVVFSEGNSQLATFHVEPVKPGTPEQMRLTGRLVWDEERTVRVLPPFAGRVTRILVKPGDGVKPGQPLALMASPDFGQAQTEARRAHSELELAQKNLSRLRELHAAGVAARKDLNMAEAEHARADAELARAGARVKLYGSAESIDQSLTIRSPIGGTVVERNINPGQELRPDAAAGAPPLFLITDPSRLWVQLDATERDLRGVRRGMRVRLHTGAWPDSAFDAVLTNVADFIDPVTRTVKVRGTVANPERKLKAEMYVSAKLETQSEARVQVPAKAVFLFGDRHYVYVQQSPGRYRRVEVRAADEHGGMVGILSGLEQGQSVVVDGALFLLRIHRQLETGAPV